VNYRLTALTPLLVGDGQKLSPIDYMVWKDQVNVLDQRRIFRLLSKGPRLEGYLQQIKKAEKLDFASWGGFAQNFAGRRIAFDSPAYSAIWNQAPVSDLHIPTFCSGINGAFLPASALKGALRTGLAASRWNEGVVREIASRAEGDRPLRRPGESAELMTLGSSHADPMRLVSASDSKPVPYSAFRVYLLRTATLESKTPGRFELAWKQAPRNSVPNTKVEQSTPTFAEMAAPGAVFEGELHEKSFLKQPEVARELHLRESASLDNILRSANEHAGNLLAAQLRYAELAQLPVLHQTLTNLQAQIAQAQSSRRVCVLNLGWGAGLLGKAAFLDTDNVDMRKILKQVSFFERALRTGMPFPKTRRIVFQDNQPGSVAGWALLEMLGS
jgi:CRISPR-associated protein Csm5